MTRTLLCALGLTAALALPGCSSGSGEATPTRTPTASVSSSPPTTTVPPAPTLTPTPTAPVFDYSKSKKTKAGAEEFGRHVVAAMSYLVHTNESLPFRQTASAACKECMAVVKTARRSHRDTPGAVAVGGDFRVISIQSTFSPNVMGTTQANLLIRVAIPAQQVTAPDGSSREVPRSTKKFAYHVQWFMDRWQVLGMGD